MSAENKDSSEQPDQDDLIFDWKNKQRVVLHMSVFLIISVVLHVSGFYLFQVVYPSAGKVEPVPDRLVLLDPADPAVRALMNRVEDRVVFLRPASEGSAARASLDDYKIRFKPLFSDREPNVKTEFPARELGLTDEKKGPEAPTARPSQ